MSISKMDPERLDLLGTWIALFGDFLSAFAQQKEINQATAAEDQDAGENDQLKDALCLLEKQIHKLEDSIASLEIRIRSLERKPGKV